MGGCGWRGPKFLVFRMAKRQQKKGSGLQASPNMLVPVASQDDAYTVHGAYLSGKREANRIGQWWTKHHSDIAGLRHES